MYAKIFTSLFDGSMRGHSDLILVFVNLLCHADQDGVVDRHWRAISDETGLTPDQTRAALTALESPDPDSRTRTDEGRRLQRIDPAREWGWQIVNFTHYRDLRSNEDRREYMRKYMQNKRKLLADCKQPLARLANTDTDTDTDTDQPICTDTGVPGSMLAPSKRVSFDGNGIVGFLDSDFVAFTAAYPAVAVLQEINRAALWLKANPAKRKKNVYRFLTNWLARCQERGGSIPSNKPGATLGTGGL